MTLTVIMLALVGAIEAVVYQSRYRATHGSALAAGLWTLNVCLLRVAWLTLGVAAAVQGEWVLAMIVYAVPAAIVTALVRAREIRREQGGRP